MKHFAPVAALLCAALPAWAIPVSIAVTDAGDEPLPSARISVVEGAGFTQKNIATGEPVGPDGTLTFEWDGAFGEANAGKRRYLYALIEAPGKAAQTRYLSAPVTTVALQPSRSWSGLVWDENGKPLANVPVVVMRWEADATANQAEKPAYFNAFAPAWRMRGVTDATGRWQIDGLPLRARVTLKLDDDRFIKQSWELLRAGDEAPPLTARVGATITGRIVTPDGAPMPDLAVFGANDSSNAPRTDAQGRFTLTGVRPGPTSLHAFATDDSPENLPDYLVPKRDGIATQAGEITDIGEWKAEAGVVINLRAVDAQTKQPIDNVSYRNSGESMHASAARDGRISLRLLAGARDSSLPVGSLDSPDYIAARITIPQEQRDAELVNLGDLAMERGVRLKGTVRIENAEADAELPDLHLQKGREQREFINLWESPGEFTTSALKPGNYQLKFGANNKTATDEWEIVSPASVVVAAPGDAAARPVEIVLKRLVEAPPPANVVREVRGQLRDAGGVGVAGAVVALQLGGNFARRTAISDAQGNFIADGAPGATAVEVKSIERAGYFLAGEAQTVIEDGVAKISGLSLVKRGRVFAGRVTNEDGSPVVGAWVAALRAPKLQPVQTGADGAFELADLPLEEFALVAAQGDAFARLETRADATGVELKLRPIATADRAALAEQALGGTADWWNLRAYQSVLGTERAAQILLNQPKGQNNLSLFELELAVTDAAEFARLAPVLLQRLQDDERALIEGELWRVRAQSGTVDDVIEANNWLDARKAEKRAINAQSVAQLAQMAAVAEALKRDDAESLLDFAAAIQAQLGKGDPNSAMKWSIPLSRLGFDAVTRFAEGMKPAAEFETMLFSAFSLSQNRDFAGANRALQRAEKLAQTPEMLANLPAQESQRPQAQLDGLRQQIAIFQAPLDPAGALELIDRVQLDWMKTPVLIRIADGAIGKGDLPLAERALRQAQLEAAKSNRGGEAIWPMMASLGGQISPQLGAELWEVATAHLRNDTAGAPSTSPAWWAFYHAALDAGQSRVLLEREWSALLPAAVEGRDEEYGWERDRLKDVVTAMAVVDATRAMEMREQVQTQVLKPDKAGAANLSLGAALLATPSQRARFGVDGLN